MKAEGPAAGTRPPVPSPLVSIVVTTRNEEKNIGRCLESIRLQTCGNTEIIVVDNFSDDRTMEIAKKYTSSVFEKGPERSAQRNYGMMETARGEYVMFVDADMILSPVLVDACVKAMRDGVALALHVPEIVLGRGYFSRVRRFERRFYDGTVIDGARFFRKEAFLKAGGFDEGMSGPEDWDMDKKIKRAGSIGLLPAAGGTPRGWPLFDFIRERGVDPARFGAVVYHNEAEFDLRKYLGKKRYYAGSFDAYIRKWGWKDPDIKKQFGPAYRYAGVFTEAGKWRRICLHPLLACGMFFLRAMVGVQYLRRRFQT